MTERKRRTKGEVEFKLTRAEGARLAHMLKTERALHAQGTALVCGIDEAGRGPLAGPVSAAAVVFPPGARIAGINDSKQLLPEEREALFSEIISKAADYGVGIASAEEIDTINILNATKLAVRRALRQMKLIPEILLLDALRLEDCTIPQQSFVKGDSRCFSIAAASILAKVTRDRMMNEYHQEFPQYCFDQHKGYATELHWQTIMEHGICTLHRRTFFDPGFLAPEPLFSRRYFIVRGKIAGADSAGGVEAALLEIRQASKFLPSAEISALTEHARTRLNLFV